MNGLTVVNLKENHKVALRPIILLDEVKHLNFFTIYSYVVYLRAKENVKHEEYPCIWPQGTKNPTYILLRRAASRLILQLDK